MRFHTELDMQVFCLIAVAVTIHATDHPNTTRPFNSMETASLTLDPFFIPRHITDNETCTVDIVIGDKFNYCKRRNGTYTEEYQTLEPTVFMGHIALIDVEVGTDGDTSKYRYKRKSNIPQRQRKGLGISGILWHKQAQGSYPYPKHCLSNPCKNGGCTVFGYSYTCQCDPGWIGVQCDTDIDECASNPCQNNATCNNNMNSYNCTCTEDFSGINCDNDTCDPNRQSGADLVFVVDFSLSEQALADQQKQYMKDFINRFPIGPSAYQVSVVSYSFQPTVHCYLNTHTNKTAVTNQIDNLIFTSGASNTGTALKAVREDVLTIVKGMRSQFRQYVIVLTDGLSSNATDTALEASLLKATGVHLFTVAFGQQIFHTELLSIASNNRRVFPPSLPDAAFAVLKQHLPACPDCTVNTSDVIVLFDSSTNLASTEFYPAIDALRIMVEVIPIGEHNVHLSYIKYAKDVHEQFNFTEYHTTSDVIAQMAQRLTQFNGPANLSKALDHVINNGFTSARGTRSDARKFVIAFTRGYFDDVTGVKTSAERLRNSGVTLATVGTGNDVNMTTLLEISSDPAFVFAVDAAFAIEYDVLQSIAGSLEFNVCEFD